MLNKEEIFIPLASPDLNDSDIAEVVNVLRSGMLIQGREVESFERAIADFIGVKHAICVSNGTATLHLILVALGIGPGDEVILPAFSYIATANVIELVGAKPIFVDIDLNTFNIDVDKIPNYITERTRAIIPVHEFGLACEMDTISKIAQQYQLFVIEDAACALGAEYYDKKVGSLSNAGSFSFHPRKAITSGEGGIITTNDSELSNKLKILRNHGISYEGSKMNFVEAGFNYRLTDFQAALVHSQFKRLNKIIDFKRSLAEIYFKEINNSKITLPKVPKNFNHTWQTFHILLDPDIKQEEIIATFKLNNVGINYGAQCIPLQTFFRKKYSLDCDKYYRNAQMAFRQGIALPIYEKLTPLDIKRISELVNKI